MGRCDPYDIGCGTVRELLGNGADSSCYDGREQYWLYGGNVSAQQICNMMDAETEALVARLTKENAELKQRAAELEADRQRLINQGGPCCDED